MGQHKALLGHYRDYPPSVTVYPPYCKAVSKPEFGEVTPGGYPRWAPHGSETEKSWGICTPLYGLYRDVPLGRPWFSVLSVLNRVMSRSGYAILWESVNKVLPARLI